MEITDKMYDYWLCSLGGIGNVSVRRLLKLCGNAKAVYEAENEMLGKVLRHSQLLALQNSKQEWSLQEEYERLEHLNIHFLSEEEEAYPQRLKQIPDAPYGLFYRGSLPEDGRMSVAVIGARDCSEYGRYVAEQLGKYLGGRGIQVISGMARGIDGISQTAAMEAGGISFGVLGSGVDVCYPAQNKGLYEKLAEQGGILSAYGPGTLPKPQNFPPRNRIVSGLADAVVVIEARERSGTLITVDMALEQGREIYVVPGRITDRLSDGCNRLLAQGASVFLSPDQFAQEMEELFWEHQARQSIRRAENDEEKDEENDGKNDKIKDEKSERNQKLRAKRQEITVLPLEESCPKLPPELLLLYEELDYTPQNLTQLQNRMHVKHGIDYACPQLTAQLMRLCINGCVIQLTPGQFCKKG